MSKLIRETMEVIPPLQEYLQHTSVAKFHEVLKQACENYLGRAVDVEKDKNVFRLVSSFDETKLFAHDKHIGSITNNIGHTDPVANKITYTITFTPLI